MFFSKDLVHDHHGRLSLIWLLGNHFDDDDSKAVTKVKPAEVLKAKVHEICLAILELFPINPRHLALRSAAIMVDGTAECHLRQIERFHKGVKRLFVCQLSRPVKAHTSKKPMIDTSEHGSLCAVEDPIENLQGDQDGDVELNFGKFTTIREAVTLREEDGARFHLREDDEGFGITHVSIGSVGNLFADEQSEIQFQTEPLADTFVTPPQETEATGTETMELLPDIINGTRRAAVKDSEKEVPAAPTRSKAPREIDNETMQEEGAQPPRSKRLRRGREVHETEVVEEPPPFPEVEIEAAVASEYTDQSPRLGATHERRRTSPIPSEEAPQLELPNVEEVQLREHTEAHEQSQGPVASSSQEPSDSPLQPLPNVQAPGPKKRKVTRVQIDKEITFDASIMRRNLEYTEDTWDRCRHFQELLKHKQRTVTFEGPARNWLIEELRDDWLARTKAPLMIPPEELPEEHQEYQEEDPSKSEIREAHERDEMLDGQSFASIGHHDKGDSGSAHALEFPELHVTDDAIIGEVIPQEGYSPERLPVMELEVPAPQKSPRSSVRSLSSSDLMEQEDILNRIRELVDVSDEGTALFKDLAANIKSRRGVAILLYKILNLEAAGRIRCFQDTNFGEIQISLM